MTGQRTRVKTCYLIALSVTGASFRTCLLILAGLASLAGVIACLLKTLSVRAGIAGVGAFPAAW